MQPKAAASRRWSCAHALIMAFDRGGG